MQQLDRVSGGSGSGEHYGREMKQQDLTYIATSDPHSGWHMPSTTPRSSLGVEQLISLLDSSLPKMESDISAYIRKLYSIKDDPMELFNISSIRDDGSLVVTRTDSSEQIIITPNSASKA